MKKTILALLLINSLSTVFAEGRQITGSGPFATLPGRGAHERQVTNADIARSNPGDYFWRRTDGQWGWYYIVQGDIAWAQNNNFMAGFAPSLPGVDEQGEVFMEYVKNDDYSRRMYDNGTIEDLITQNSEFNDALAEFRKLYSSPVPRRNSTITGAGQNWYYSNAVPNDFPAIFWASITLEGRIMKVVVANGYGYKLSVSYWATDGFVKEYPNAQWSWAGVDDAHSLDAKKIQEDVSLTYQVQEYSN